MDYKAQTFFKNSTGVLSTLKNDHKSEYGKVFHLLDELGFSNLKGQFNEHQIMDSTLTYMESEEELKILLKEIGLPAGPVFAFVKLWFRYKGNAGNLVSAVDNELDKSYLSNNSVNDHMEVADLTADDKNTQTDTVSTIDVATQTHIPGLYQAQLLQPTDPYDMISPFASFPYLASRMPLPSNLPPHGTGAYGLAQWPYSPLPNIYPGTSNFNDAPSEFTGLVNGVSEENNFDPLENFSPLDAFESDIPLEKNGSEVAVESDGLRDASSEYALFPNKEPLCSPKSSHRDLMNEMLQAEQDREQKSYATALKDHKEGQQSLPNSLQSDPILSPPGARSRSSSTTSNTNLSRSASSNDFHPLSPTRKTNEVLPTSSPNRPYVGVDDIDPQQKAILIKSRSLQNHSNASFTDYYDNLPETPEYQEGIKEKNAKAGWRPLSGKHEKSGRRMEFKPQYIDKDGRMRHGIRVRGALKSMECWLHTNSKPPIDCLFAHSRIGDTLEFICIRCTYEKPRSHECRDKKGHAAYICNLGAYRDITGDKWRGRVEPSNTQ